MVSLVYPPPIARLLVAWAVILAHQPIAASSGLARPGFAAATPPLIGVVRAGDSLSVQGCQRALSFHPADSQIRALTGSGADLRLATDVPGDYVVWCNVSRNSVPARRRYLAVTFPEPGTRALPLTYLSTTFQPNEWADASPPAKDSDRRAGFWSRSSVNDGWLGAASDAAGVVHGRQSFFAEPLEYNVSGVTLGGGASFQLSLQDAHGGGGTGGGRITLTADAKSGALWLETVSAESKRLCSTRGIAAGVAYNFTLRIGPRNVSLSGSGKAPGGGAAATDVVCMREGGHGINWREWSASDGRTTLYVAVHGNATPPALTPIRLVESTRLLPDLDPLRPPHLLPPASRTRQPWAMPAVLGPHTDTVPLFGSSFGALQPLSAHGLLDVTAPPFNADASGSRDATAAIQAAIDLARWHYLVVYLPGGRYKVTSTLLLQQTARMMATGDVPGPLPGAGPTPDFLLDGVSTRYVPHGLRGATSPGVAGPTATLVVPANTFPDALSPQPVVQFRYLNPMREEEPNAMYNTVMTSIAVEVGRHNAGAIGVQLRGAQGSGLEDVNVTFLGGDAPDAGLVGVAGGCGSGGAHHGVGVTGGRYAMDLRGSQPASTISGVRLVGQSCAAVVYEGFETLTAVGVEIVQFRGAAAVLADFPLNLPTRGDCALPTPAEDPQPTNSAIAGMMSWVDAAIEFAPRTLARGAQPATVAFATNKSLLLKNVWVRGAALVVAQNGTAVPPASSLSNWTVVGLFARGVATRGPGLTLRMPTYVDGQRFATGAAVLSNVSTGPQAGPPSTLRSAHTWGPAASYPSFESDGAINVRLAPYHAAADGVHDDTQAIQQALAAAAKAPSGDGVVFLPRGTYAVSAPLSVPPGVSVVGVAKHLTVLVTVADKGLVGGDATAMVAFPAAAAHTGGQGSSRPALAFVSVFIPNSASSTSALLWQHQGGTLRQFHPHRVNRCGSYDGPGCRNATVINHAVVTVSGPGASVDMYNFFLEDCCRTSTFAWQPTAFWPGYLSGPQGPRYRHLLVTDGAGPLRFYHLNCEHGTGEAICELANGTHDVDIYGFKTEGNTAALWLRDVNRVSLYGSGGVGCVPNNTAWPAGFEPAVPSLFRVQRSSNILLANLMDQSHHASGPNEFNERGCDPASVNTVAVGTSDSRDAFVTQAFDRPVAFVLHG